MLDRIARGQRHRVEARMTELPNARPFTHASPGDSSRPRCKGAATLTILSTTAGEQTRQAVWAQRSPRRAP